MTQRFVEGNGVTEEILQVLPIGDHLGPFDFDFEINPSKRKGEVGSGYPNSSLTLSRLSEAAIKMVIAVRKNSGRIVFQFSVPGAWKQLSGKDFAVPGEIKNLGE